MAYERTENRVLGDSLDSFVANTMKFFGQQLEIRNAIDETNFYKSIDQNNLSLEDQLAYRREQLKRVSDDPAEKKRVQQEVTTLKQRVEQQQFLNTYSEKVASANAGTASIDSVISWLMDQKINAKDPSVISSINNQLETWQGKKFDATKNLLDAQTSFALSDKSTQLLQEQISKVGGAKAQALLSGNTELAGAYDLQIQQLQKALTVNTIQKDINNLAVNTITGASSATGLLDSYNSKITSADTSTPITIGGVAYANAQEYWKFVRDSYVADSSGSGLLPRINDELTTAVKVKNSNNTLTATDVSDATRTYNQLYGRPELANFTAKIDAAKADTLQTAANYLSDKIESTYNNTYDLNKAVTDLNALKSQGVNIDNSMNKILNSATSLKSNNIDQIVSTAQQLMASTPGLAISDAVNQAIQRGAGVVLSPNQLLNSNPETIASDVLNAGAQGTNTPDRTTTIKPENQSATGLPTPAPLPGAPAAPAGNPTSAGGNYTIRSGDTLSAIASKYGTTVSALAAANGIANPDRIQAGSTLKIPSAATSPNVQPTQVSAPAPTPQYSAPVNNPNPVAPAAQPANPTPVAQSPSVSNNTYLIKSGDYLGKIAQMHGTTVDALVKLNNIANPDKIQAGATLKIK